MIIQQLFYVSLLYVHRSCYVNWLDDDDHKNRYDAELK